MSIQESIDRSPFSRRQYFIVGLCFVINVVEGFDIFVMAFAASGVAADWGLTGSQLGVLLSATPIGMAIGSFFIAPLADRVGRRPLVIWCLVACGAGMVLAAVAPNYPVLLGARVLTGLGIGGIAAGLPVILAEYTPYRRRGTIIPFYVAGPSLGGVLGGVTSAYLIAEHGWRAPFLAGSVATLVLIGVVVASMPESITFLLARRPPDALAHANRLLSQIRQPELSELPAPDAADRPARSVRFAVFGPGTVAKTSLIWIAFFCTLAVYYFATSWTPRLLQASGASAAQAVQSGILLNAGGFVASTLFAALALRLSTRVLAAVALFGAAGALLLMNAVFGDLGGVLSAAVVLGLCVNGSMAGVFAIVPDLYPPLVRTTAVGWAIGAGRVGAILAPLLTGVLLDRSWTPGGLMVLFAVPATLAGLAVLVVTRAGRAAQTQWGPATTTALDVDRGGSQPAR